MSKPAGEDLFTFSGRRNRKSYCFFILMSTIVYTILQLILISALETSLSLQVAIVLAALIYIPLIVAVLAVGAQRCRDFGWSGWAILLTLIPLIGLLFGLAMLVIPGNKGENRYGSDPLEGDKPDVDVFPTVPEA